MELLNNLLAHYQRLFKDKQQEISLILGAIKKQTGLAITNSEIKMRDGVLFLKTKPKYKLEIILKKKEILEYLQKQGLKVVDLK